MNNFLKRNKNIFEKLYKIFLVMLLIYLVIRVIHFPIPAKTIKVGDNILVIAINVIIIVVFICYGLEDFFNIYNIKIKDYIISELRKISKEIPIYFIYVVTYSFILGFFINGISQNEQAINSSLHEPMLLFNIIYIVIIGPFIEEVTFRFYIRKLIKNKYMYIIIATIVFASLHVYDDPNSLTYIWLYIPEAFYFTYRYYKTDDLLVPISLHSFNNLVCLILKFI